MDYIQIPIPDFNFSNAIKHKADLIIRTRLRDLSITHGNNLKNAENRTIIENEFYQLVSVEDKLLFVNDFITHITNLKIEFKNACKQKNQNSRIGEDRLNDFLYFLYGLLSKVINVNFNTEIFSEDEITLLNKKIDSIIDSLDRIYLANELVYNTIDGLNDEFDTLKTELESFKTDYITGKKKWYQRLTGMFFSFTGSKVADIVFEKMKPELADLLLHHTMPLIEKLLSS